MGLLPELIVHVLQIILIVLILMRNNRTDAVKNNGKLVYRKTGKTMTRQQMMRLESEPEPEEQAPSSLNEDRIAEKVAKLLLDHLGDSKLSPYFSPVPRENKIELPKIDETVVDTGVSIDNLEYNSEQALGKEETKKDKGLSSSKSKLKKMRNK